MTESRHHTVTPFILGAGGIIAFALGIPGWGLMGGGIAMVAWRHLAVRDRLDGCGFLIICVCLLSGIWIFNGVLLPSGLSTMGNVASKLVGIGLVIFGLFAIYLAHSVGLGADASHQLSSRSNLSDAQSTCPPTLSDLTRPKDVSPDSSKLYRPASPSATDYE